MKTKPDDSRLYNSRIIDTYTKLIKKKYSYINLSELLSYAKIEPYQVADEGHWFTQEQVDLFHEKMENLTRNKDIAREGGRYAASPETLGSMRQLILGFLDPPQVYSAVGKYASNFTKSATYETKTINPHKIEIKVTQKKGVNEKPFQCKNRIGYFEAASLIFKYRLPEIEHPECFFKGGNVCNYIISWRESRFAFWRNIRNYTALLLFAGCIGSYFVYPWTTLMAIFSFPVFAILALSFYVKILETKELNTAVDNIRVSTDKLLEQIDINYNNSLMINETGLSLSKQMDIDNILSNVMQAFEKRLYYDRGMILLANQERSMLSFRVGFGYTAEQLNMLENTSFHLDRPESKGIFVVSFREQKPFLINDINEIESSLSPHSLEFAKNLGVKSFICCPIIYDKIPLGILAVDNIKTKRPLVQSDISLLLGIAPEIGISIHNCILFESKQRQFESILLTLAASIDARDSLTAGHSERVTEYTQGICRELKMPKDYSEMIRIASLLHDYGKIGIKDSVLMKPSKLNVEERKEIETHSAKTKEILEQIHFEGIYKEIPAIAGSHHEKIDGSGYPNGLKAEEIPLGAKIIAVADFFEAITSKRHYRDPMPLDRAFQLLKEETGKSFDRKVVEAFISYYGKKNNKKLSQNGL